jgi:hypothetical protein
MNHPKKSSKKKCYRWTEEQQKKYVHFLAENISLFKMNYLDKMNLKVHVRMSRFIPNRNSYQCRSHHQKMMVKYGSIENLIKKFSYLLASMNLKKAQ